MSNEQTYYDLVRRYHVAEYGQHLFYHVGQVIEQFRLAGLPPTACAICLHEATAAALPEPHPKKE